jgi:toxin-antitoxin system PIN domain toxin
MPGTPVFVDTNVLLYASRPKANEHARSQAALSRMRQDGTPLWLSRQVFREYLAAATRPQVSGPALPMAAAIADVHALRAAFNVAEDGPTVFDRLLHLLAAYPGGGKQVHDANLVATMLEHRITRLLTFNAGDFRRFGTLIEVVAP